ncbi:DUF1799 domain-containing protein [Rugamonas sp. DEMB1]|uniref:DUF1799 domain-containing protein n=1 Tax=Rugamonas sp. DEMB1 TaxID=3039386 RepID=UPI0024495079|nr:DUF1799 domain-containing protein [Rugamonas sp. DEMB1]WGG53401.1 DUF1799 domain-containing protein [Rugamonas sp. DEMB1]
MEVWPDNWPAFALFCEQQTQWTVGPGGATGMNYACAFRKLDRMGLTPDECSEWEGDLRTLEHAALSEMNKKEDA